MKAVRPPPPVTITGPAGGAWQAQLDDLQRAAGPLPRRLLASWRIELDAAEARVRAAGWRLPATDPLPSDGMHALLVLAGARLGRRWDVHQLIDAAAAVELADRAVRWHGAVRDGPPGNPRRHGHNVTQVLGGDLAITQAALLVAEIGPAAYRLLVRGYGAAQLTRFAPVGTVGPAPLQAAALALGALVGGLDEVASTGVASTGVASAAVVTGDAIRLPPGSPVRQVWHWAVASGVRP
jgi:hypothetical protein